MSVKAVTFDFWCTLFENARGTTRQQLRIDALAKAAHQPAERVAEVLKDVWREFDRSHREDRVTKTPREAVELACAAMGVTLDPAAADGVATVFAEAILAHAPEPVEGAAEAVRAAAERGPVGIISDTGISPGASLKVLLDRAGMTPYFGALAFSNEVGVAKPQRPMFVHAAEGLGVRPEELLHIGDLEYTDVRGAKAVGAKAALFTGVNAAHAADTTADYVFATWRAFTDALPEIFA